MAAFTREQHRNSDVGSTDFYPANNDNVWDADFQYKDGVRFDNGDSNLQTDWANLVCSDLEKSAKRGSSVAQACLSHMYQEGFGVRRDPKKAFRWCSEAARQEGQADAMYELGLMYLDGVGITRCRSSAFKLLKGAGEQNHAKALFKLAEMQIDDSFGKTNPTFAFKTCLKAAKLNYPEAQFNVGVMFERGIGTNQNFQEAVFWYKKASENGNKHSLNNLGNMYVNGLGVPKDINVAKSLFYAASDCGSGLADFNLAVLYGQCEIGQASAVRSLTLFFMASLKGVKEATFVLKRLKQIFPRRTLISANAKAISSHVSGQKIRKKL